MDIQNEVVMTWVVVNKKVFREIGSRTLGFLGLVGRKEGLRRI